MHLSASDTGGSGVDFTEYKLDGGDWTTGTEVTVAAPPEGTNNGDHVLRYRSYDLAGNLEEAQTCHVQIDTSAPQTTDDAPAGWVNAPLTVTLWASDAGCGVLQTQYRLDGGGWRRGTSVVIAAPANPPTTASTPSTTARWTGCSTSKRHAPAG